VTTKSSDQELPLDLLRIIDANLNRLKEGIRVVEDIARYIDNNFELASSLKALRHKSTIQETNELLASRDSTNDVLRPTTASEMARSDLKSIIIANYKRAQESSRVLEEMYKILHPEYSEMFKTIRYTLYMLEKENILNLSE